MPVYVCRFYGHIELLTSFGAGYIHQESRDWVGWRSRDCSEKTVGTQNQYSMLMT